MSTVGTSLLLSLAGKGKIVIFGGIFLTSGIVFPLFTTFGKMRQIFAFHAGSKSSACTLDLWLNVLGVHIDVLLHV